MPTSDQCISCVNFLGKASCIAYPNGIPYEIISGIDAHDKPQPGQEGNFIWEKRTPEGFQRVLEYWLKDSD